MNWTVEEIRAVWEAGKRAGRLAEQARIADLLMGGADLRAKALAAADEHWGKVAAMLEGKLGETARFQIDP